LAQKKLRFTPNKFTQDGQVTRNAPHFQLETNPCLKTARALRARFGQHKRRIETPDEFLPEVHPNATCPIEKS
jgi:hypothetical protein